jgi:hypothetical protein
MTDPEEKQEDREELDVDAEKVNDLEPDDQDVEQVKGGAVAKSCYAASSALC